MVVQLYLKQCRDGDLENNIPSRKTVIGAGNRGLIRLKALPTREILYKNKTKSGRIRIIRENLWTISEKKQKNKKIVMWPCAT